MKIPNLEKKDIILINPHLSQEERYGVKFKAGGQTPPTGLAILAAVARQNNYKVAIIDGAALNLNSDEIIEKILELNPKYVGLTAVTISIFNAMEIAKKLKEKTNSIKIILGGPHITAAPYDTFKKFETLIDIAVIGEAEITLIELLYALEKNKNLKNIKGLIYKKNNKVVTTPPRGFIANLDTLPIPAWDLLPNLAKYYCPPVHTLKRVPAALLVTSRGCPGQCIFCDKKVFGRRYRWHSPGYILNLMKILKKDYGIKEIQFRDDNILVNRQGLRKLCQLMIKEKLDIIWSCAGRIDMVDSEILNLMKKAGCWQIWYGIESGSDKVLKIIRKDITVNNIKKAIYWTHKAGISPAGFFMIGMPSETEKDIKKTIGLSLELPLDEFHISHLTPFPGSELYTIACNYGTFENDWKKMNGWKILFVPKDLTKEKLTYYSNFAFKKFYFRPRIIFNYIKKINSLSLLKIYSEAFAGFLIYILQKNRG